MRYLSVCSGIEAASVAWHPLGWSPVAFAEIEPFPSAVLAHHFPGVPNWGDITKFKDWPDADVDVLVGGTPCQSFSLAGLRTGLDDPRGNLMLTYLAIAARYRPQWLVWENVPGVLSSNGGRDFGAFLGGLGLCGYGFAYRVLDAQFVRVQSHPGAVPQRRRRVFVVGCLGDWRRAAAVLLERESLLGHPAPRREAGKGSAAGTLRGTDGGSDVDHARAGHLAVAGSVVARAGRNGGASNADVDGGQLIPFGVAHSLTGEGFDASEDGTGRGTPLVVQPITHTLDTSSAGRATEDGTGRGVPLVPVAVFTSDGEVADPIGANEGRTYTNEGENNFRLHNCVGMPVAFDTTQVTHPANRSNPKAGDPCHPLVAQGHPPAIAFQSATEFLPQSSRVYSEDEASPTLQATGSRMGNRAPAVAFSCKDHGADAGDIAPTLRSMGHDGSHANGGGQMTVAYAFQPRIARNGRGDMGDVASALSAQSGETGKGDVAPCIAAGMQVRRLTPLECERLQGFPDGWTAVPFRGKPAADGPRYKAIGNSFAVNVVSWLGQRIQMASEVP